VTVALGIFLFVGVVFAEDSKPGDAVRTTIDRATDWIARQARPVPDETVDGVLFPEAQGEDELSARVYGGTAGVLIYLENVAAVLNDERARKLADQTVRGLIASRGVKDGIPTWAKGPRESAASLYIGDAGVGAAFLVRARLRKDESALKTAMEIGDALLARGIREGETLHWADNQVDIIFGAAGTVLFLLDLGQETKEPRFTDAALAAGRWLISKAETEPAKAESGGRRLFWRLSLFGNRHMPNFSHGTAGVAYALARVSAVTKDKACLEAAKDGAEWMLAHQIVEGDTVCWAATEGSKRCMAGWCHGPPGTARLFLLLHQLTGEQRYLDAALASARWVIGYAAAAEKSGQAAGFPPSLCCGVAGVVDFFCDLYRTTRKKEFADFAARGGKYLIDAAKADGAGVKWRNGSSAHGGREDRFGVDLMLGASGEALGLLRLATLEANPDPVQHLPDRAVAVK
jgi:lantibiotic modifying enzyme